MVNNDRHLTMYMYGRTFTVQMKIMNLAQMFTIFLGSFSPY
jgi:hypothetical protein